MWKMPPDERILKALSEPGPQSIILSEFYSVEESRSQDEAYVRSREQMLLMRAENTRLMYQGIAGKLLRYEWARRPQRGLARIPNGEDHGFNIVLTVDLEVVSPDDGALDEQGKFVRFPELRVERADKQYPHFDEWFSSQAPTLTENISRLVALRGGGGLDLFRALALAAYREGQRHGR